MCSIQSQDCSTQKLAERCFRVFRLDVVGLRIAGDHGKGLPASQAAPSIFDARYVRWLSQLKDRMHKLAINGLRRPYGEGLPAADGDTADLPQNSHDTAAALQRCLLCLCILHLDCLPSLPVTSSIEASLHSMNSICLTHPYPYSHDMCHCREVDALKVQLERAHQEREVSTRPQSSPAHEQELQAAKARAQQAAAASAQHLKELTASKGQHTLLLSWPCPWTLGLHKQTVALRYFQTSQSANLAHLSLCTYAYLAVLQCSPHRVTVYEV